MNEIGQLFAAYLDPNNPNPEEAGNALLSRFCSSIDLLFTIIQNEPNLRERCVIFLKRVLDLTLDQMNDEQRKKVFAFVTMILIPNILPQNPSYLSPTIYEIFSQVSQKAGVDPASLNNYVKSLNGPCFLSFIIIYLDNLNPNLLDLEFTCNIMVAALGTNDITLIKLCFRLFVVLCNNFPSSPVFATFSERFVAISVNMHTPFIWNTLCDLSKVFTPPFMNVALTIFPNNSFDFEDRISSFFFFVSNIDSSHLKTLPHLLNLLIEFQVIHLNEYDCIDPSLFLLYPKTLEIPEIRSQAFELIKNSSFQLLSLNSPVHQVAGLFSLEFLIDNSHEMALIECIPSDLSIFHPFLASGNPRMIEAVFEILKVLIGKPLGSHFSYEMIFQDVINLFLNADDNIRNRAAVFSYRYLRSHFVVTFWMFRKFIQILHLVKYSELSIYLEILADSILPNMINVSDAEIDSLVAITTEILSSNRDLEVKVSAASLCCSLIKKDGDLIFKIANQAIANAFLAIDQPNPIMRKTMSLCLIRFIKCMSGKYISYFREFYPKILKCSIVNNMLSLYREPILVTEIIRWDPELPNKEVFCSLLVSTIINPPNEKQYKIASKCLKKIITGFPIQVQIQLTVHICKNIFDPKFFKLIRSNTLILCAMLKEKNPQENRIHIAQIVSTTLRPFTDDILKLYIGSLCRLISCVISSIGPNVPENLKQFCYQLFQKANESPLLFTHYNLFLFSNCIKYSVVEVNVINSILQSAFKQLSGNFTNWDASCSLLCVKAGIEKNPGILNEERMMILVNCWARMSNDLSMILSKSYLANIFILLGCQNLIPLELFISSIQAFPMEIKFITGEVCQLFLANFQDLTGKNPNVVREIVLGIIRLLSAGRSIRYTHKLKYEVVEGMVRLGYSLATAIGLDINQAIQVSLPDSPRKQASVARIIKEIISM